MMTDNKCRMSHKTTVKYRKNAQRSPKNKFDCTETAINISLFQE